jgi:salicylate hydroxylase
MSSLLPDQQAAASVQNTAANALLLNVLVAGAGLGGLATAIALARRGHKVTVLEQAPALGEVGAGIQIPSNSARLLLRWGLGKYLASIINEPENISMRRWENGEVIGLTRLIPDFQQSFGAPYYVIHRAHLHDALHNLALELGVKVELDSTVVDYDLDAPSLTLQNGAVHHGDLIIGADGASYILFAGYSKR